MKKDSDAREKIDLSILIPLFNEKENLKPLFQKIKETISSLGVEWEIVFADDGSRDGSFEELVDIKESSRRVKVISLRRNFGKSAALDAGFKIVRGERVIIMDADLQDDPEEIPALLNKIDEGYDLITGWRATRKDRFIKKYTSRIFNRVTSLMSGIRLHDFNCGLKAFRGEVVKDLDLYGELHRYIPVLAHWKGYRVGEIKVRHHRRAAGESKFGSYRFFAGFMDMVTVMFLTRYVKKPLHLFGGVGVVMFSTGLIINTYLLLRIMMGHGTGVRPLLLFGVLLMLIGFQLISTGLLGEMMAMSIHRKKGDYTIKQVLS